MISSLALHIELCVLGPLANIANSGKVLLGYEFPQSPIGIPCHRRYQKNFFFYFSIWLLGFAKTLNMALELNQCSRVSLVTQRMAIAFQSHLKRQLNTIGWHSVPNSN